MRRTRPVADVVSATLALALAAFVPQARAQQIVGHLSLLPAQAGLNPLAPFKTVVNPAAPELFVLHSRGVTALVPGVTPTFVNYQVGAEDVSFPYDIAFDAAAQRVYVTDAGDDTLVVID